MKLKWMVGIFLFFCFIITAELTQIKKFEKDSQNYLSVYFIDVGQGDSIYIKTPVGNNILIDGGPRASMVTQLQKILPGKNNEIIDLVIATHPDQDHIGGLKQIFETFQISHYMTSAITSETNTFESLQSQILLEKNLETITALRGQRIIIDKKYGVYIDILFPDQDTRYFKDSNEASIILRLVYKNKSFLLTGDAPASIESWLTTYDKQHIQSTVLKLGHHGSKTSSDESFLKQINGTYAIISAGKNNRYGHPEQNVISRTEKYFSRILSTQDLGTIEFVTDGNTLWVQ